MDVRDFWEDLPEKVQAVYLEKADEFRPLPAVRAAEVTIAKIALADACIEKERAWVVFEESDERPHSDKGRRYFAAVDNYHEQLRKVQALLDSA